MILLVGDPMLVGERLAEIQRHDLGEKPALGALDVLQGDRADIEGLATAIRTVAPGGRRLVVVRHAEKMRDEVQRGLLGLLDDVADGTRVVVVAYEPDMRRALFAGLRERHRLERLELGSPRDPAGTRRELLSLAEGRARGLGLKLAPDALQAVVEFVANDPGRLVRELEKLALRWGDAPIGVREALDGLGGERALAAFALEGAVRERRVARAVAELRALLQQGERIEVIVGQVAGELRALLRARALLDSGLDEEGAKRAFGGGRGYFVVPGARNYRRAELEAALSGLRGVDLAAKTGQVSPEGRLERLLLGLARAR